MHPKLLRESYLSIVRSTSLHFTCNSAPNNDEAFYTELTRGIIEIDILTIRRWDYFSASNASHVVAWPESSYTVATRTDQLVALAKRWSWTFDETPDGIAVDNPLSYGQLSKIHTLATTLKISDWLLRHVLWIWY